MLQLANNCRIGNICVTPSNWKSTDANHKSIWRISYWFYDDSLKEKKLIVIKGMNRYSTLKEKQDSIKTLLEYEMDLLKVQGWNHITKSGTVITPNEVSEDTPMWAALEYAVKSISVEDETRIDMKSMLKYFLLSSKSLQLQFIPIDQVKRKHIKLILDHCAKVKTYWSNNLYNHYRKYLSALFTELLDIEAVDSNPVTSLAKKKTVKNIREELTLKERKIVDNYLRTQDYRFWLFSQIFFHSGSRMIELLRLTGSDIDLAGQRFKVVVKKGKRGREEWRPIKDVALPFWEEACENLNKNYFLFSVGLLPGSTRIRRELITHRWKKLVKDPLSITADFYSLKHTNLDETAAQLSIQAAAEMAGHSTPVITLDYAKGERGRQEDRLKKVNNSFSY